MAIDNPAPVMADSRPDDLAQARQSPLRAGFTLTLLLALYTLSFIDRTILSLLIEPIKRDLHLTDLSVSLLIGTAFSIFYATAGHPLSYLADRWNRRNLIVIGVSLWSLMTAMGGFAQSFSALFVARMGVGLGEAALSPAAYSLIADTFPKERTGRAMAIYTIGATLGAGLALILGGLVVRAVTASPSFELPIVGVLQPWRAVLVCVGMPGLVLAGLMLLTREPARGGAGSAPAPHDQIALTTFLISHWRLFAPLFLALGLFSAASYGALMWIPSLFIRTFAMTTAQAALPFGLVVAVSGIAGMLTGGSWADRLRQGGVSDAYVRVLLYGAIGGLPAFILAPLMPTSALMLAVLFVAFFCHSLQAGLPAASIHLVTPRHLRARVVAIYLLVTALAGVGLGPTLVALATRYVFDESHLGRAIALSNAFVLPTVVLLYGVALRSFRRIVAVGGL